MRLLLLSVVALSLISADRLKEPIRKGKDYALFFAVDDYSNNRQYKNLRNPIKDANAIAKELSEMYGFETKVYANPSKSNIYNALRTWSNKSYAEDAQLFVFFSGHGEFDEFESKGFFIPNGSEKIDLTSLANIITKIPCKHILLAIDACYSGTIDQAIAFKGAPAFSRPNGTPKTERQNIISRQLRNQSRLLITSGGKQRTPDGNKHSPFSAALLKGLRKAYTSGDGLLTYTDLLGYLERVSPLPHEGELPQHEDGGFVFVSSDLSTYTATTNTPSRNSTPTANTNISDFPNGHEMKLVPSGTFTQGSRKVTLDAYWIDQHEVTNEQYARFLNEYGSDKVKSGEYKGQKMIYKYQRGVKKVGSRWQAQSGYEKHPVVYVTWYGANEYARHYGLKLPTEAEWEYAARGGTDKNPYTYAGSNNIEDVAWYGENSYAKGSKHKDYGLHQVMTKKANMLGLFDMSGNVWEWCWDWYGDYPSKEERNPKGAATGRYRVLRGGSWYINPSDCRVSYRVSDYPDFRINYVGFRCARAR